MDYMCGTLLYEITNGVVLHTDVFYICMIGVVFSELSCSIIVAIEGHAHAEGVAKTLQQFPKEDKFLSSVMQCDVFSIT